MTRSKTFMGLIIALALVFSLPMTANAQASLSASLADSTVADTTNAGLTFTVGSTGEVDSILVAVDYYDAHWDAFTDSTPAGYEVIYYDESEDTSGVIDVDTVYLHLFEFKATNGLYIEIASAGLSVDVDDTLYVTIPGVVNDSIAGSGDGGGYGLYMATFGPVGPKGPIEGASTGIIALQPDVPYELRVVQQPLSWANAGEAFGTQPVFGIYDEFGNLCNEATDLVTVAAVLAVDSTLAGHGILRGTKTVAAVAGIATFTDLNYTKVEDIRIKATGSLPAFTNAIEIYYGYPASIVFSPTSATVGVFGTVGLDATLTDSFANPADEEWIYFYVIQGAGYVDPDEGGTDLSGTVSTTFHASQYAGTETVKGVWYYFTKQPSDSVFSTVDIEVTPGPLAKVDATPADTVVVVTEDAIIVAQLTDNWGNPIDATDINQVTFATSGLGTMGPKSLTDDKEIEMVYTTDDSMATDTITASIVGHSDLSFVHTIGGVPASAVLTADDSTVVVSDTTNIEDLNVALFDEYDNPSAYSDYHALPSPEFYEVIFTSSAGGGLFGPVTKNGPQPVDTVSVDENGEAQIYYYSSTVAGTYTVTAMSEAASDDVPITQTPEILAGVVLTPDSMAIPAGMPYKLTAELQDQYENHINATATTDVVFSKVDGQGTLGTTNTLEDDSTVSVVYTAYEVTADTAHIKAVANSFEDIIVIFSAEPGALDHFTLDPVPDELDVPDYTTVVITAEDGNNIRLYTWSNPNIVILTLSGSAADPSQVTWLISDDTTHYHGFNAMVPESAFVEGVCTVEVANEKAETDPVTASMLGVSGTSDPITWLPIDLYSFGVVAQGDSIFVDVPFSFTVTPYDTFMNVTPVGLPRWIEFSPNESGVSLPVFQLYNATTVYSATASNPSDSLQVTVVTMTGVPFIYGISDDIIVNPAAGIPEDEALPIVYSLKVPDLGSKTIQYAVPERAPVSISLFDKLGRRVGVLVDKTHDPGYYQVHLDRVRIPSGVYFIKMESPSFNSTKKMLLLK